jgi:hypothetical protein
MDITLYDQDLDKTQLITVTNNDELFTMTHIYFNIIPKDQQFVYNDKILNNDTNCLDWGIAQNDIVHVQSTDAVPAESINDYKDQMIMEAAIPYTLRYLKAEFNGYEFKVLVDTGASISIMTETMSKSLSVDHLIDTRMKGKVHGVGNSNILGCILNLNIRLGVSDNVINAPTNFRVIEDGFDKHMVILGLDFLTSHKCMISFIDQTITIDNQPLKFLNEADVQAICEPTNILQKICDKFIKSITNDKTIDLIKMVMTNIVKNPDINKYRTLNINSRQIIDIGQDKDILVDILTFIGFRTNDDKLKFTGSIEKLSLLVKCLN